jgi:adenylylsulfate kinase
VRFGLNAAPKTLRETRHYSEAQANRFGLTFAAEDRVENIRRIGEVAKLFADAGMITLTSFISPYRHDRAAVRASHANHPGGALPFYEIYVATPLAICEQRDPKGLYKQARAAIAAGQGMGFTGIDDPYEAPEYPDLTIDMEAQTVEAGLTQILNFLAQQGIFS